MNVELLWAFGTGFAGSLHCLGMCGPLVIAYSLQLGSGTALDSDHQKSLQLFSHHAAFHVGRVFAYGFIGSAAAGLVFFGNLSSSVQAIRIPVSIAGGCIMILFGLIILKIIPAERLTRLLSAPNGSFISRTINNLLMSRRISLKTALGFSVGFLPCMLSWSMVVKAALTANIAAGFLTMIFFGFGTVPALLFAGLFASLISMKAANWRTHRRFFSCCDGTHSSVEGDNKTCLAHSLHLKAKS